MTDFTISQGFSPAERPEIARLYWQAFAAKLTRVLGSEHPARAFFADIVSPEFALVARGPDGTILGLAGFKTAKGALTGGGRRDIARHYGWLGALWRGPLLALLERKLAADILLMDGICVDVPARGRGVGSALLAAIKEHAQTLGLARVRLDVIDINNRARALYERQGFVAGRTEDTGPLRYLFGFSKTTTMIWTAPQPDI